MSVAKEVAVYIPDFGTTKPEQREEIRPVIVDKKVIHVKIGEPTTTGTIKITFSDYVILTGNMTEWTSANEGKERLEI